MCKYPNFLWHLWMFMFRCMHCEYWLIRHFLLEFRLMCENEVKRVSRDDVTKMCLSSCFFLLKKQIVSNNNIIKQNELISKIIQNRYSQTYFFIQNVDRFVHSNRYLVSFKIELGLESHFHRLSCSLHITLSQ